MRVNLQATIYSKTIQLICICFWKGVEKELYGTDQLLSILMTEFTHGCKLSISSDKLFTHYTPENTVELEPYQEKSCACHMEKIRMQIRLSPGAVWPATALLANSKIWK